MFRTATYKPAICDCDVFRDEGDHQNRNAFTLLIYGIALIFIATLFLTVFFLRDSAEIRQNLYEPCNKTDILSVPEVKNLIESNKFSKVVAESFEKAKEMMKIERLFCEHPTFGQHIFETIIDCQITKSVIEEIKAKKNSQISVFPFVQLMPKSKLFKPACCKCNVFSPVQHLNTERLYALVWLISWTLLFINLSILYECLQSVDKNNSELLDNRNLFEPCNISGIINFDELQQTNNTKKELINLNKSLLKIEKYYPQHGTRIQPIHDSIISNITIIQKILQSQKQKRQICYYSNLQSFAKFTAFKAAKLICLPLICIFISWYLTLFIILTHKFQSKFVEVSYKKLYKLIRKTFLVTLFVLFLISCSLCFVVIRTFLKDFDDYVK